jgi:predicted TIM-barrel fold metal-dependent hydrolase
LSAAEPFLDIIDCHTHFYDPSRPGGVPWPGKGSSLYRTVLPRHLREQKTYRKVTGTVIVEASPLVGDNDWLLGLAKDDPFIVGIVGNLNPDDPMFANHARRLARNALFRGIRINSGLLKGDISKERIAAFRLLAELDLALDVNGGPETPGLLAGLARAVPGLRIVLNHIGNVEVTGKTPPAEWVAGIRSAAENPNVWCKVSALVEGAARRGGKAPADPVFYKPCLDAVWTAFGAKRLIYGSDWPVCEAAADYGVMQKISMDDAASRGTAALAGFCSLNAKDAYKWIERPGRL